MIREATRAAFDAESRRLAGLPERQPTASELSGIVGGYGPTRTETLDQVEARLERQAVAAKLIDELYEWHAKAAKYNNPTDWARQVATVLLTEMSITRKAK